MTENPAAPVCYRHPRKETYVKCVRCERPICPDCMTQASVGWQCPECVDSGKKSVRPARSAFGGIGGHNGITTKILVGINVAIFVIGLALAGSNAIGGLLSGGETPLHYLGALWAPPYNDVLDTYGQHISGIAGGAFYRFLTSMFLHYGLIHLAFNMYVLWIIGRFLERDLGPVRYLGLYLMSGLGGGVLTYLVADMSASINEPNSWSMTAGASGCIFGLFGATVFLNRKMGRDNSGIYVLLGLNLVLTFVMSNISWTGHVGGLLTGAALGAAIAHAPRAKRTMVHVGAFVLAALILAALVIWRTNALWTMVGSAT